jgi:hypothetical protein
VPLIFDITAAAKNLLSSHSGCDAQMPLNFLPSQLITMILLL